MAKTSEDRRLPKKEYEARVPDLRAALVQMQVELKASPFPLLLVIAGEEASGKGEVVNILNAWLDPRGVETFSFHEPTDEERERPPMWRYWRSLPPRGRMGAFHLSRYHDFDYEDHGPDALAAFLKMKKEEIFPIAWDVRHLVSGAPSAVHGQILAEPRERLSRAHLIALAVP